MDSVDLGLVGAGRGVGPTVPARTTLADQGVAAFDAILTDLGAHAGVNPTVASNSHNTLPAPRTGNGSDRRTNDARRADGGRSTAHAAAHDEARTASVRHAGDEATERPSEPDPRRRVETDRRSARVRKDDDTTDPSASRATDGTGSAQHAADRAGADAEAQAASHSGASTASHESAAVEEQDASPETPTSDQVASHHRQHHQPLASALPTATGIVAPDASTGENVAANGVGADTAAFPTTPTLETPAQDVPTSAPIGQAVDVADAPTGGAMPEPNRLPSTAAQSGSSGVSYPHGVKGHRTIELAPAIAGQTGIDRLLEPDGSATGNAPSLVESNAASSATAAPGGARRTGISQALSATPSTHAAEGARVVARQVLATLLAGTEPSQDSRGDGTPVSPMPPVTPSPNLASFVPGEALGANAAQRLLEQAVDRASGTAVPVVARETVPAVAAAGLDTAGTGSRSNGHGAGSGDGGAGARQGTGRLSSAFDLSAAPGLVLSPTGGGATSLGAVSGTTSSEATTGDFQLAQQVVRAVSLAWRGNTGEAQVRLTPDHLGEVTVSLKVTDGNVSATLQAETTAARDWIKAHEAELRQGLQEQGLTLERFVVNADGGRGRENQAQDQDGQQQPRHRRGGQVSYPGAPRFELEA